MIDYARRYVVFSIDGLENGLLSKRLGRSQTGTLSTTLLNRSVSCFDSVAEGSITLPGSRTCWIQQATRLPTLMIRTVKSLALICKPSQLRDSISDVDRAVCPEAPDRAVFTHF